MCEKLSAKVAFRTGSNVTEVRCSLPCCYCSVVALRLLQRLPNIANWLNPISMVDVLSAGHYFGDSLLRCDLACGYDTVVHVFVRTVASFGDQVVEHGNWKILVFA